MQKDLHKFNQLHEIDNQIELSPEKISILFEIIIQEMDSTIDANNFSNNFMFATSALTKHFSAQSQKIGYWRLLLDVINFSSTSKKLKSFSFSKNEPLKIDTFQDLKILFEIIKENQLNERVAIHCDFEKIFPEKNNWIIDSCADTPVTPDDYMMTADGLPRLTQSIVSFAEPDSQRQLSIFKFFAVAAALFSILSILLSSIIPTGIYLFISFISQASLSVISTSLLLHSTQHSFDLYTISTSKWASKFFNLSLVISIAIYSLNATTLVENNNWILLSTLGILMFFASLSLILFEYYLSIIEIRHNQLVSK